MAKTHSEINTASNRIVPIVLNEAVDQVASSTTTTMTAEQNSSIEEENGNEPSQHEEHGFENDGTYTKSPPSKSSLEISSGNAVDNSTENSSTDYPTQQTAASSNQSPRFGGLSELVDTSIRSIHSASSHILNTFIKVNTEPLASFAISAKDLSDVSSERTPQSLARVLSKATKNLPPVLPGEEESLSNVKLQIESLVQRIGTTDDTHEHHTSVIDPLKIKKLDNEEDVERQKHDMELAANALATVILRSKPEEGISNIQSDIDYRTEIFGTNAIANKKLDSFLKLCWDAVQESPR